MSDGTEECAEEARDKKKNKEGEEARIPANSNKFAGRRRVRMKRGRVNSQRKERKT